MKKLLFSAIYASALVWMSATPSSALTCGTGCNSSPTPMIFTGDNNAGNFGDTQIPTTSSFTDQFLFDLVAPPSLFNSLTDSISALDGIIQGLTLSIYSCGLAPTCSGAALVESSSSPAITDLPDPPFPPDSFVQSISVVANDLTPGYYYIQVTGAGTSQNPGTARSYGGNITLNAVPLPETLGLFAGGLALLAFAGTFGRKRIGRAPA